MKIPSKTPVSLPVFRELSRLTNRKIGNFLRLAKMQSGTFSLVTKMQPGTFFAQTGNFPVAVCAGMKEPVSKPPRHLPSPNASRRPTPVVGSARLWGSLAPTSKWLTMSHNVSPTASRRPRPLGGPGKITSAGGEIIVGTARHPQPRGAPADASGDSLTPGASRDTVGATANSGPAARRKYIAEERDDELDRD